MILKPIYFYRLLHSCTQKSMAWHLAVPQVEFVVCQWNDWAYINEDSLLILQRSFIVKFLKNTHNRHPIDCPHGQAMGCLLWVQNQLYGLYFSSHLFAAMILLCCICTGIYCIYCPYWYDCDVYSTMVDGKQWSYLVSESDKLHSIVIHCDIGLYNTWTQLYVRSEQHISLVYRNH